MNVMSLFAGIGGFDLAARWMGWESKVMVEWDPYCQKVLHKNFPEAHIHGDITTFDANPYRGAIDLVCGGFPCQPYSTAGKRLGKEDDRHLWPQMLRVIQETSPRWVVGENVRGILNWGKGMVVNEVLTDLENAGYTPLPPFLLPAGAVNADHERYRTWFVAYSEQVRQQRPGHRERYSSSEEWPACSDQQNDRRYLRAEAGQGVGLPRDRAGRYCAPEVCSPPSQPPVLRGNDGLPYRLDPSARNARIGAMGNAIMPQVVHPIFQAIQHIEDAL